ncbi:MAG: hypothetical protein RJQ21_14560 [Rhodospirillales bacterium]
MQQSPSNHGTTDRTFELPVLVMGMLVCAALFLFVLSLPPFHLGLSVQTESAAAGLHAVASGLALCAVPLLFGAGTGPKPDLRDPVFLLILALAAWTTLTGALSGRLLGSLSGPLDQGVGGLALLEGAIVYLAARHVFRFAFWRKAVVAAAVTAFLAILVLDATGRAGRGFAPYYFGDYIAFVAFAFLAISVSLPAMRRNTLLALALPACAWAIVQSGNKAGLLGFALMILTAPVVMRLPQRFRWLVCAMPVTLAVAMPVAIYAVGSAYAPEDFDRLLVSYGHALVPSYLLSVWASVWSRAMLIKVSFAEILDGAGGFLGSGWGSFGEALVRHLRVVDSRHHELVGDTLTYWDAIQRTDFHSHNFMTEALLAGGPVAAAILLLVLWRLAVAWRTRGDILPVAWLAGIVPVASFWFQLPLTIAWLAVAVAALTPAESAEKQPGRIGRRLVTAGMSALVAVILALAAVTAFRDTLTAGRLLKTAFGTAEIAVRCGRDDLTLWHRDAYLAQLVSVQADRYRAAADGPERRVTGERLSALICNADARIAAAQPLPLPLVTTLVNASGLLRFVSGGSPATGPVAELVGMWDGLADHLMVLAPGRTDLLIPYFNHLLLEGREERVMALAGTVLEMRPEEPVSLWFTGLVMLGSDGTAAEGLARLQAAARHGVANLMPIPAELRETLGLPRR